MAVNVENLKSHIEKIVPEIISLRHDLHQIPEIGFKEFKTSARVREELGKLGIECRDPLIETDVVAEIDAGKDTTISLRADMDALPIQEMSDLPYKSKTDGMMHACGHDGHTSLMIGVANTLNTFKDQLPVNVRLVFQPAEEMQCGGKTLIEKGACEGTSAAYALHGWPGTDPGDISCREGAILAAGGGFEMRIKGKGCHGAMPHKGKNPLPAAGAIAVAFQEIHHRVNKENGSVVTVGAINGGYTTSIVPEDATILGTIRYLKTEWGDAIEAELREKAANICQQYDVECDIEFSREYDLPVFNSAESHETIKTLTEEHIGAGRFHEVAEPSMANEDFAFYLKDRPGAMFWLGAGKDSPPLHNPRYNFNDDSFFNGILMFSLIALNHSS